MGKSTKITVGRRNGKMQVTKTVTQSVPRPIGNYGGRRLRIRSGKRQPIHYFTRTVYLPGFYNLVAGGPAVGTARNFKLSDVPNASEFTQLFDQYCIKMVKMSLIPRFTEVSNTSTQGNIWSVLDYDDSIAPPNVDTVLQYENVKRTRMSQIHTRYFKPAVADEIYATGVATTYGAKKNQFLDCTNDAVEHYGVKLWFDTRATNVIYDVQIKFYLAFKNVR